MRTLNIAISDLEFNTFGLRSNSLSFSDLLDIVSKELSKQRLKESLKLAEKFGLSEMTMDEITKEADLNLSSLLTEITIQPADETDNILSNPVFTQVLQDRIAEYEKLP